MDPLTPVTGRIDQTEELIGHSPHPAIFALPIGAWTVSCVCDGLALATGDRRFDEVARISMAIGLGGAAVSVLTGLHDYSFIPQDRPSHDIATAHDLGNAVVGTLFTASSLLRDREHQGGRRPSLLTRILGLTGGSLALYTARLGGVLVEEYGEGVKPVLDRIDQPRDGHEESVRGHDRLAADSPR